MTRYIQQECLKWLRIYGPCSPLGIARRVGVPASRIYVAFRQLVDAGLVRHDRDGNWDVTLKGRAAFARVYGDLRTIYGEIT